MTCLDMSLNVGNPKVERFSMNNTTFGRFLHVFVSNLVGKCRFGAAVSLRLVIHIHIINGMVSLCGAGWVHGKLTRLRQNFLGPFLSSRL